MLFYAGYAISSLDTELSLRHRTQNCMLRVLFYMHAVFAVQVVAVWFAVYAVYAISSLDTELSLRHLIQNSLVGNTHSEADST